ncbi:hypothetical protein JZO81_19490 [Enterococcus hulanensis]|uniref:AbiH family protein n=1 Tax=Enterococcus hulanensis TaxID=2559929 RepID=UPI001A91AF20|nr:AbiH family protein [Enterococcus hulanensis]MBO0413244.1 hypothetical protein [Enterococcus hulanensis]
MLFYYSIDKLPDEWNDIENRIKDFFSETENSEFTYKKMFDTDRSYLSSSGKMLLSIFLGLFPENRYCDFKDPVDFLKHELLILEKSFSEYLEKLVKNKSSYHPECRELLLQLLTESKETNFSGGIFSDKILSFNYTDPIGNSTLSYNSYPRQKELNGSRVEDNKRFWDQVKKMTINVHGSLEKQDVVFGFDSVDKEQLDDFYRFSKTYRQLIGSFSSEVHAFQLESAISKVVFFGHSLSLLDYSYFQAIFDHYSLYDSSIKLYFYYANLNSSSREDMVKKVLHLLTYYSRSLDNSYHRKNLLHKLLLEKRLFIIPLEDELGKIKKKSS